MQSIESKHKRCSMKIAFTNIEEWEKDYIKKKLKGHKIVFLSTSLDEKNFLKKKAQIQDADILSVFIYSDINKNLISKLPKMKCITTMSTGFDHIDIGECKKKGIKVFNVPTYGENTVAEHTFALILSLSRKIPEAVAKTRSGSFDLDGLRGFDLKSRTIGVVGLGNIGKHVVRIAKGFEMKVLASDPKVSATAAKKIGAKKVSFNTLLKQSDIISFHCPYNKYTHHLLNKKTIKLLKKGAYVINTSRGRIIETDALVFGLKKGILSGVGLDVLEGECFIREEKELLDTMFRQKCDLKTIVEDHMLMSHPKVIVTPHNAFNSKEALYRILDTTISNIKCFVSKRNKQNLVC